MCLSNFWDTLCIWELKIGLFVAEIFEHTQSRENGIMDLHVPDTCPLTVNRLCQSYQPLSKHYLSVLKQILATCLFT